MKKDKKVNKIKKAKVGKKSKFNGWLTAIGVCAGVAVVSGGTVLGVYLTGGFEEKIVMPESIVYEYDASKFNNGQLEIGVNEPFDAKVKQTFKLKITSPTERVTEDEVTLSFFNQPQYNKPDSEGFISNTIIRLPQIVPLNKEFEVELCTEDLKASEDSSEYILDENDDHIDWIKGGISTIEAQSADNEQSPIKLTIAVDVPVYKTETQIINSKGIIVDKVVTNEQFTVKSKFIPEKSEYMFADNESSQEENDWRKKRTFFESSNNFAITQEYDGKYSTIFRVGENQATGLEIKSYTYQTAYSQILAEKALLEEKGSLEEISNDDYYIGMLEKVSASLPLDKVEKTIFDIEEANILNYTVLKNSQTIKAQTDKSLRLFMNEYAYYNNSDYIGANIYDESGALLDGMLKNIAIAIVSGDKDSTVGTDSSVTVSGDSVEIDGINYYKPTIAGANPRYSFWDINPTKEQSLTIKTILLVDGVPFEISDKALVYSINLEVKKYFDEKVSWKDTTELKFVLDYDQNGKPDPKPLPNLSALTNIPENNVYKDVIYFISFGKEDKSVYKDIMDKSIISYDYDKSGTYATSGANLTMFAVDGSDITLHDSCKFNLYFATVELINGQYQYESDGRYKIICMSENYISVTCEKALNEKSVESAVLDTSLFTANGNVTNIPQGTTNTFAVKFNIQKEAVDVFEEEFDNDYITLVVKDDEGNDISSLFTIYSNNLDKTAATLTYNLLLKSAVQIENEEGINLGEVSLKYDNKDSRKIEWPFTLNKNFAYQNVCVYKPIAKSVQIIVDAVITGDTFANVLNGTENYEVSVNQVLNSAGSFVTTLSCLDDNGEVKIFGTYKDFLDAIFNGRTIEIKDQKGSTTTLENQWKYVVAEGDESIITINADGQSFAFKTADNKQLSLKIQSLDNKATLNGVEIKFVIKSQGITKVSYSNLENTYLEDNKETYTEETKNFSEVKVSKFGAKGESNKYIILSDLIKFYVSEDNQYTKISFKFSPQFLSKQNLSTEQVLSLFDNGGMLTLYNSSAENIDNDIQDYIQDKQLPETDLDARADAIRTFLQSKEISKIYINHNFAINQILEFNVSDGSGAVNTNFKLDLTPNIIVTSSDYEIYAAVDTELAGHKVSYINNNQTNQSFSGLYGSGSYYIVYDNTNSKYTLTSSVPAEGESYIATYINGQINFVDFWDESQKSYTIYFQPEGDNYYTLNQSINFTVKRNLIIESKDLPYYVLSSNSNSISDYFTIGREEGTADISLDLDFKFDKYFADNTNVEYNEGTLDTEGTKFFFDYSVKELKSHLTIYIADTDIKLAEEEISIKPYHNGTDEVDIYKSIAGKIESTSPAGYLAQTQVVGDTEYIVFDANDNEWKRTSNAIGNATFRMTAEDYYGNNLSHIYSGDGEYIWLESQSDMLFGLENKEVYLVVTFASGNTDLATLHIPMILSELGYETVRYDDAKVAEEKRLETALSAPETLIEKEIFNEITAGKVATLITEYQVGDSVSKGLHALKDKFSYTLKYYPLSTSDEYYSYEELIKGFSDGYKKISLNHLANLNKPVYLALEYKLEENSTLKVKTLYYLLKVIPDTVTEATVYAYNGEAEYISGAVDKINSVDVEKIYNEKTLNENYKPFNVSKQLMLTNGTEITIKVNSTSAWIKFSQIGKDSIIKEFTSPGEKNINLNDNNEYFKDGIDTTKPVNIMIMDGDVEISYNDEKIFQTLKFKNEVVSVKVGDEDPVYNQEDWEKDIDLTFSADYKKLEYMPKTTEKIEIVVKHTYIGSLSENDLSVVGAEQFYKFILNGSASNYVVKFVEGNTEKIASEYTLNLDNGDTTKEYSLDILLLNQDDAGGSGTDTTVTGKLQVQLTEGKENIAESNFDENGMFKGYNNQTGEFTLTLKDYIETDKQVKFAIFTEEGYLATLTINLTANASYTAKVTELNGGTAEKKIRDLFTITYNNANSDGTPEIITKIEVAAISGDIDFVITQNTDNDTNANIQVADLIKDKQVTFRFKFTFNDGNTFTFDYTFTLKANITPKATAGSADTKIIAGEEHQIILNSLYEGGLSSSTVPSIKSWSSSSPAVKDVNTIGDKVSTDYVSATTPVSIILTVQLMFFNDNTDAVQTFNVVYSFTVEPSVEIVPNYPNPTGAEEMKFEYVDDGQTFSDILTNFLAENPIFGTEMRIVMKTGAITTEGEGDAAKDVVKYETGLEYTSDDNKSNVKVAITDIQNASLLKSDSTHGTINEEISGAITFKRGNYVASSNSYNDLGSDSFIEFTITYQNVSEKYLVYIMTNSLSVQLNSASNNVANGNEYIDENKETQTQTVSYETIYVDKTNSENLFAENRMFYAQMSDTMADYANEYYLVFRKDNSDAAGTENKLANDEFYASYPIYFKDSYVSQNLYFDLGFSMADKTFYGAYLTSTFESKKIGVGANGLLKITTDTSTVNLTYDDIKEITSLDRHLFKQQRLANRVQLVYGPDILVDYDLYKGSINDLTISKSTYENIDKIYKYSPTKPFARNDGSSNESETFAVNYYFKPSIDIEVENKASEAGKFIELKVGVEYPSLANLFKVYHPTNGNIISSTDFAISSTKLNFEVLNDPNLSDIPETSYYATFLSEVKQDKFLKQPGNDAEYLYLFTSAVENASKHICDYYLRPLGAQNAGNYVLGMITYEAAGYVKTFYVVAKIMPDYVVQYRTAEDSTGMSQQTTTESDFSISNVENKISISKRIDNEKFATIVLNGDSSQEESVIGPLVSIKHAGSDAELSATRFDITMPLGYSYGDTIYNKEENVNAKILYTGHSNSDWTDYKVAMGTQAKFTGIKNIVFADQYYMVQGVDPYGYVFKLYFILKAQDRAPEVNGTISLVEEEYFDVGLQYEYLSISQTGEGEAVTYSINAVPTMPKDPTDANVTMINIEGIKAWLFDKDYTTATNETYLEEKGTSGYKAKSGTTVSFDDSVKHYLDAPRFKDITIEGIKLYRPNDLNSPIKQLSYINGDNSNTKSESLPFATDGQGVFNGIDKDANKKIRSANSINSDTQKAEGLWKVPRIDETDIYQGATSANLTMIITLKYVNGGITEYYDLPVDVSLSRAVVITQTNDKIARDGQAIDMSKQFAAIDGATQTYTNDTLEVLVKGLSTATFDMTLTRSGVASQPVSITLSNASTSYDKTFYISLSSYFNKNVKAGDTITISNMNGNVQGLYYISSSSQTGTLTINENSEVNATITIGNITNDFIYIENAALINNSNAYYHVDKYYIMNCTIGGTPYSYRVTRNYIVTGYYYQLEKTYEKNGNFIGFTMNPDSVDVRDGVNYYPNATVSIDKWKDDSYRLLGAKYLDSAVSKDVTNDLAVADSAPDKVDDGDIVIDHIKFSIEKTGAEISGMTVGSATIDGSGTITLGETFNENQYIKVALEIPVSGVDRNITNTADATYHKLGTLDLTTVRQFSAA